MIAAILACSTDPRPNLLLVSLDTTRFDRTSLGAARDTTPNLARLAAEGTSFTSAFAVANESLTSHAALLTGRYPSEIALPEYSSFALPRGVPTVASRLQEAGYATGAFTGGGHLVAAFGFDHGFDTFHAAEGDTRFASLSDSVPAALAWMEAQDRPWFAFVHGYDAHTPYLQPGPFRHPWGAEGASEWIEGLVADPLALEQVRGDTWFPDRAPADFLHAAGRRILDPELYRLPVEPVEGERAERLSRLEQEHLRDHYDSGLAWGDLWLGVLLAHVRLSDTLVVVLADHGEDLLDHGFVTHRPGLWDSTLHVPLVVAGPGVRVGTRDELVELRRVTATLLDAAGLPPDGEPLGRAVAAPAVFAEGILGQVSARTDTARVVEGGERACFAVDPFERATVDCEPAATRALEAWKAGLRRATEPGASVPAAVRDGLERRGYWGGG